MKTKEQIITDCLVIGSGVSGLICALEVAKKKDVILVTKKEIMESNTNYAQGGIAAVISKQDSFRRHISDTLTTGDGLSDKKIAELVVRQAPRVIQQLIDMGAGFNQIEGKLHLGREGGHSSNRIVHARDATGKEIERALVANVRKNSRILVMEHTTVIDLLIQNQACNAVTLQRLDENESCLVRAKNVVIATGSAGQVYERTTNPKIATGDGIAMAALAGARLENMEFVQFHPTTLNKAGCPHYLISEAVRGEGARLINSTGKRFMKQYHPLGELAPRDIVSRAILTEEKNGKVYLDLTDKSKDFIKNRFPNIYYTLWWYNLKIDKDPIPVTPAAHYFCGGIKTDINAETSITGLYAIGEVASTGLHGANRLASNSLLESIVFAKQAAKHILKKRSKDLKPQKYEMPKLTKSDKEDQYAGQIRKIMWKNVGIIRNKTGLRKAQKQISRIYKKNKISAKSGYNNYRLTTRNMAISALLIIESALRRKESRGTHYRSDYPNKLPDQQAQPTSISIDDIQGFL